VQASVVHEVVDDYEDLISVEHDEVPKHVIDEQARVLQLTPFAGRQTRSTLKASEEVVFQGQEYQSLPRESLGIQSSGRVTTELSTDFRTINFVPTTEQYTPEEFAIKTQNGDVEISSSAGRFTVSPDNEESITLDTETTRGKVYGDSDAREITLIPRIKVRNYGQLDVAEAESHWRLGRSGPISPYISWTFGRVLAESPLPENDR
jgi:hypothetical protein